MSARWVGLCFCVGFVLPGALTAQDKPPKGSAPPEVAVVHPFERKVSDYVKFVGRIEAQQQVDLRPRVSGYITKVCYKPGAIVHKDDVLFELDARSYQAAVAQAEANLRLAQAQAAQAKAMSNRVLDAVNKGVAGQADADAAKTKQLAAEAQVQAAQAHVQSAKVLLSYTKVRAPMTGRIDRPHVTVGNRVRADATSLATIVSVDPVCVSFDLDQQTYLLVMKRFGKAKAPLQRPVVVRLGSDTAAYQTKVEFTDNHFEAGKAALHASALLSNPKNKLLPGMAAEVYVSVSDPHLAVFVPSEAIVDENGDYGARVAVVNNRHRVQLVRCELGAPYGDFRVVRKGLARSDQVIKGLPVPVGSNVTAVLKPEPKRTSDQFLP